MLIALMCAILAIAEAIGWGGADHLKIATFLSIAIVALIAPKIASLSVGKDGFTANLAQKIDENSEKIDSTKVVAIELDNQLEQKLRQIFEELAQIRKALESGSGEAQVGVRRVDEELPPATVNNDPQKGRFGGLEKNEGLVIGAEVKQSEFDPEWQTVTITVRATSDPDLLKGSVEFFLHDTFSPDYYRIPVVNGEAKLVLRAWGAFTVGAIAGVEKTRLELDLATSRNVAAPKAWRER
ncbi:pYEATS domain-containing protein [Ciceribacter sp. L1K22]|uniref:pYEATS domain-containing protein n=1 Tax=Ciceribacter sp. L1K22 TaxID=2820275 RepID=UPI001ABECBC4|nr:pYEATS domain-containing protein [Ciceribacter sp. L1K22]MBO3760008.1 hypothetical protein [Ciceribacter sp. L1K22]